jgi:hypothetical protein
LLLFIHRIHIPYRVCFCCIVNDDSLRARSRVY